MTASCSCSPGACHGGHTINMGMPNTAPNLTTCDHVGCGAIFPGVPLVGRTHAHEERAAHADWHLSNKYMRTDRCPDHWPTDGEVEQQADRLADERLTQLRDDEYVCVTDDVRSMAGELLAARARLAELEAELDLQQRSQARLVVKLANAKRESSAYPLPERCQATTVDPTNVFRPSCAWCVLPNGHQGMHRAELTQDAEPATLEWLTAPDDRSEVTD